MHSFIFPLIWDLDIELYLLSKENWMENVKLNEKVPSIVLMHVCPGAVTVVSKTVLFFFEPSVATENPN